MHEGLVHILPLLQLIQEDALDGGNDKNEKEEVIKRKIPYILKRQLYENKPRRPYILKRGSYYYWEDKYFIYMWSWFIIFHLNIKLYLCGNVTVHSCVSSTIVVYWTWFFCIDINGTKCFKINLDLEHDNVLCIIGVDIN